MQKVKFYKIEKYLSLSGEIKIYQYRAFNKNDVKARYDHFHRLSKIHPSKIIEIEALDKSYGFEDLTIGKN